MDTASDTISSTDNLSGWVVDCGNTATGATTDYHVGNGDWLELASARTSN